MNFVIHHHNENEFDNAGYCEIIWPFETIELAKEALKQLVVNYNDDLFKIDQDPDSIQDGTYAGFYYEDLHNSNRNEDLCNEYWAEIVELTPSKLK